MKQALIIFVFGSVSFFVISFFRFATLSLIHGAIASSAYFLLIKIKVSYSIERGLDWLRKAVYVALFPYLFWFIATFLIGVDAVIGLHNQYTFLLGPIAIIVDVITTVFTSMPLGYGFLLATILWWLLPLGLGIYVTKKSEI